LPFSGPIGGVRVALIKDQWVAFPTHPQLEQATFDMVVAGRVLDDGEVAIMMVEPESTPQTLKLLADAENTGAVRPRRGRPWPRASRRLSRSSPRCARHSGSSPPRRSRPVIAPATTSQFPLFVDYGEDVFEAVAAAVSDELAQALTVTGKQERGAEEDRVKVLAHERLAEKFEGREKEINAAIRSLTRSWSASGWSTTGCVSTGAGSPTSGRSRPRSACCPGCTARRCSSGARPRSWASPR